MKRKQEMGPWMLMFIGSQKKKRAVDTVRFRSASCVWSWGGDRVLGDSRASQSRCLSNDRTVCLGLLVLLERSTDWIIYRVLQVEKSKVR